VVERLFLTRIKGPERVVMSILVTYAVSLVIEGVLNMVFSTNYVELHAWYVDRSVKVFGIYLPYIYLLGFAMAVVLLTALYVMLYRTRFGSSVRASLADQTSAAWWHQRQTSLDRVLWSWRRVTAAGGMIYARQRLQREFELRPHQCLLVIIVLGGMGSIGGALVAGIMMVTIEDLVSVVWDRCGRILRSSSSWSSYCRFVPGLFGKQTVRVA